MKKRVLNKSLNNTAMQLRKICNHPYLFLDSDDHGDDQVRDGTHQEPFYIIGVERTRSSAPWGPFGRPVLYCPLLHHVAHNTYPYAVACPILQHIAHYYKIQSGL
jgi:SNF2 family DNA or RNA helicase